MAALLFSVCLTVSRWGRLQLSVWRTSSPLSPEWTSGSNTETPGTLCWPTSILFERPRKRFQFLKSYFLSLPPSLCLPSYNRLFSLVRWKLWVQCKVQRPWRNWRLRFFGFPRQAATRPGWKLFALPCSTVEESRVRLCCCPGRCVSWVLSLISVLKTIFDVCFRVLHRIMTHTVLSITNKFNYRFTYTTQYLDVSKVL